MTEDLGSYPPPPPGAQPFPQHGWAATASAPERAAAVSGPPPGWSPTPFSGHMAGWSATPVPGSPVVPTSFFRALFDIKFRSFIARRAATFVYIVHIVMTGIGVVCALAVVAYFAPKITDDLGTVGAILLLLLVIATFVFALFAVIIGRLVLEFFVSGTIIAENSEQILAKMRES